MGLRYVKLAYIMIHRQLLLGLTRSAAAGSFRGFANGESNIN